MAAPLSPTLLRDTVKKVEKCMGRLQELQRVVGDGRRKTKADLNLSISESLWSKYDKARRSPPGKLPTNTEGWRRMSLPAMLLGETMEEIKQATQFTTNIVDAAVSSSKSSSINNPKTPPTQSRLLHKQTTEQYHSQLLTRSRKTEKQAALRSESSDIQNRAKSQIHFKKPSPPEKENWRYIAANRVSPRNRPWARKTVLFPNPLFQSSPESAPMVARHTRQVPHKFLIKSPTRPTAGCSVKKSPKASNAAKLRRSFSPSRLANRIVSPMEKNERGMGKLLPRSFSPSRVVNRLLLSPLKSRKTVHKNGEMKVIMSGGLKQRPKVEATHSCLPLRASQC